MAIDFTTQGGDPNCGDGTIVIGDINIEIEPHIVDWCPDGSYDGQEAMIFLYSDGKIEYCLKQPGAIKQPVIDKSKVECSFCKGGNQYFEIVRLAYDSPNEFAVPGTPSLPGVTPSTLQPGRKYLLTGQFDEISLTPLRDTAIDAELVLKYGDNEIGYKMGKGCHFETALPMLKKLGCNGFNQEIEIITGDCMYLEIQITRTIQN